MTARARRGRTWRRGKYSPSRVAAIRRRWLDGEPLPSLVARYRMPKSTLWAIVADVPRAALEAVGEESWRLDDDAGPEGITRAMKPLPGPEAAAPPPPTATTILPPEPGPWPRHDAPAIGSEHGRAKLDEPRVDELRRLRTLGVSYPELARRFGISRSNVWYILSGTTWRHVPMPGRTTTGGDRSGRTTILPGAGTC